MSSSSKKTSTPSSSSTSSSSSSSSSSLSIKVNDDTDSMPLLVAFPQGIPQDYQDMKVLIGEKVSSSKKRKRMIVTTHKNMLYQGIDYGDQSIKNDSCSYAIGVLDKNTNSISIYSCNHSYIMKPKFSAFANEPVRLASLSNQKVRESLTEEFGSKKKKRAVKSKLSNIILSENIQGASAMSDVMTSKYGNMDTEQELVIVDAAKEALEGNRLKMLPPYNVNTEDVEDIYPMDTLIPNDTILNLYTFIDELMSVFNDDSYTESSGKASEVDDITADDVNGKRSLLLLNTLEKWFVKQNAGDHVLSSLRNKLKSLNKAIAKEDIKKLKKKLNTQMVKLEVAKLLLLHYITKFYLIISTKYGNSMMKEELMQSLDISSDVLFFIGEKFGVFKRVKGSGAYTLPKSNIDKLLMYTIILYLTMNKFTINLDAFASEYKVTSHKMSTLSREVGCQVSKEGTANVAKLVAPVTFPEKKKKRGT